MTRFVRPVYQTYCVEVGNEPFGLPFTSVGQGKAPILMNSTDKPQISLRTCLPFKERLSLINSQIVSSDLVTIDKPYLYPRYKYRTKTTQISAMISADAVGLFTLAMQASCNMYCNAVLLHIVAYCIEFETMPNMHVNCLQLTVSKRVNNMFSAGCTVENIQLIYYFNE